MEMPVIKRILDFCAALAISITGLPVLVAICLLVRIEWTKLPDLGGKI